ncbi:MAG: hypothetical protein JRF33_18455, partial [Deltaproteobacteria bacterium]|nr:hypothetical protein [Deltaproteobacteria bacterium]
MRKSLLCAVLFAALPFILGAGQAKAQDCNFNSVPDAEDISTGTSADCQADGVPDECQRLLSAGMMRNGLEANAVAILALVPDLALFLNDGGDNYISEGINDMYDDGNYLSTDLASEFDYTGGVLVASDEIFGAGSKYFTWHQPGLFVMMAEDIQINSFSITGETGADGEGMAMSESFPMTHKGMAYTLFAKRIWASGDSSINQFIVLKGLGQGLEQSIQYYTDDDFHGLTGLAGHGRLLYVLTARDNDEFLGTEDAIDLVRAILDQASDCDLNDVLDACDISDNPSLDCDDNGVMDACEMIDCDNSGVLDVCEILADPSLDCEGNGILDVCEYVDCDTSDSHDGCDIAADASLDCDGNGVIDSCEWPDCDTNGQADICQILDGSSEDCNANQIPDECDLSSGFSTDLNDNGLPDECEDCNENGQPDDMDIANATSLDQNSNGLPDECEDCNENGLPDDMDIEAGTSLDCDVNGLPDECEMLANDCDGNGILDVCDIAAGTHDDCDSNGLPDVCDLAWVDVRVIPASFEMIALDYSDSCDDCVSNVFSLGFEVNLGGHVFTSFQMSSNGLVELLGDSESPVNPGYGYLTTVTESDPSHTYLLVAFDDLSSSYNGYYGYTLEADRAVFTWNTETYSDADYGLLNQMQAILYMDGRVQLNFGMSRMESYSNDLASGLFLGYEQGRWIPVAEGYIPENASWLIEASRDCNSNGGLDACDILDGISEDCDMDLVPDECEMDTDDDGIIDDCDTCSAHDGLIGTVCDSLLDPDVCATGHYTCPNGVLLCDDDEADDMLLEGVACDSPIDADTCESGILDCTWGVMICSDDDADDDLDGDGIFDCEDSCDGDDAMIGAACDSLEDADSCATGVFNCDTGWLLCTDDAADDDADADGIGDCEDSCDGDNALIAQACDGDDADACATGTWECGTGTLVCSDDAADDDADADGIGDCDDSCDGDDTLIGQACDGDDADACATGAWDCGTGTLLCTDDAAEDDADADGVSDCEDDCVGDNSLVGQACDSTVDADDCATGTWSCAGGTLTCLDNDADDDADADGVYDCDDGCPLDADKSAAGECGCGVSDADTDSDGVLDCNDGCPSDADKSAAGECGCGVSDADTDADGVLDCMDNCPAIANPEQTDADSDGIGDACAGGDEGSVSGSSGCGCAAGGDQA